MKVEMMGIRSSALNTINWYLSYRKQRVVAIDGNVGNRIASGWTNFNRGVPQGSNLGPIFYALFANDLPSSTNRILTMYGDDSSIIVL